MTLSLLRKIPAVDQKARTGGVVGSDVGNELKGKTVGIIGTGAIGSRVGELFSCFGCRVLGDDVSQESFHLLPMFRWKNYYIIQISLPFIAR